jgi:hypothetical protein
LRLTSQTGMFGEIVFTPCSWGPQMVPSNYGLTETCRSALFRYNGAQFTISPLTFDQSEEVIPDLGRCRSPRSSAT